MDYIIELDEGTFIADEEIISYPGHGTSHKGKLKKMALKNGLRQF